MILWNRNQKAINTWQYLDELPIWNFDKVKQTGDTKYLYVDWKKGKDNLQELWRRLQDEFIEQVDMSDTQKHVLEKSKKWVMNKLDEIIGEGQISRKKVENKKIEQELSQELTKEKQSLTDQIAILNIWKPGLVDEMKTSVKLFYKYLKQYGEYVEKINNKGAS